MDSISFRRFSFGLGLNGAGRHRRPHQSGARRRWNLFRRTPAAEPPH